MSEITWLNYVPDPKVVNQLDVLNPTLSKEWACGFEAFGGGSFGDAALMVASGGPLAGTPRFARGSSGAVVVETASIGYGQGAEAIPGTAFWDQFVTFRIWGRINRAATAYTRVSGFTAGGVYIADLTFGDPTPVAANTWQQFGGVLVLPSGWDRIHVYVEFILDTPATAIVDGSAAMFAPWVDGVEYSGPYFDGDTTDVPGIALYQWLGTANASPSSLTVTYEAPVAAAATIPASAVPVPSTTTARTFKELQLTGFTVTEDSTPSTPSDRAGGVGSMSLLADETGDTPYLRNVPIDLIDPTQGTTRGVIRLPSASDGRATLVADSRLSLLVVRRDAQPFVGTLADALRYYLELCAIVDGIVIEDSLELIDVTFHGWSAEVWEQIKDICSIYAIECSLVSNNVVFRPIRQRVAETYRDSSRGWTLNVSQQVQNVEIYQYVTEEATNDLIYPRGGWDENVEIISVAAGETLEKTIEVEGSITSVDQPVYTDGILPGDGSASVYSVSGNDNLPIPAAQWADYGGSVSVRISDDSRSLILTVVAPSEERWAPYRIAVPSGEGNFYSTLRLVGDGLLYTKILHSFPTAVDPDQVSQISSPPVDSPYIQTDQQLTDVAMTELQYWGGTRRTVSVASRGINRLGDSGSYSYATFEDFDAWWDADTPGADLGDFDAQAAALYGTSLGDFDDYWIAAVSNDFANQAFGNVAGARMRDDAHFSRIRNATITPAGITYTAVEDSVFGDHDEVWDDAVPGGAVFGEFDVAWDGFTFGDFDATPLREVM